MEKKFKVGDRVRIIGNTAGSVNKIGEIGVIRDIRSYVKENELARVIIGKRIIHDGNWSFLQDLQLLSNLNQNIKIL